MRVRDGVSLGFGGAALATAVLAIGGADRWAQALVAMLVAGAILPQILSRRVFSRWSPLVALPSIAIGLTALQLVPLPDGLLQVLTPTGAALRDDGAKLAHVSPWNALSLDAPQTVRALIFYVILLGVAVVALRVSASERGRYRVLTAVAAICGLTALIVGIHEVLGLTRLYGFYDLEQAHPAVIGPLLNENHLGCLMAVGTAVSLGLAMHRRQHSVVRALWLMNVGACGAVTVASHSRGATLALICGLAVTLGSRLGQRMFGTTGSIRRPSFARGSLPIAVVAASAVVVILYASAGGVAARFERTSLEEASAPKSRFEAWKSSIRLIEEAPWVGVGRGAMEAAFTRVHPASAYATYAYVENEYLQAVVDWGVPGALVLGAVTLWLLGCAARRWRDGALAAGALGALAAVVTQSNFDFGIELLGVAVPITAVAATLAYVPLREVTGRPLALARGLRAAHVLALIASAGVLFTPSTTSLLEDHDALQARTGVGIADVRSSIERHPLDYYGYALAAQALAKAGDNGAIRLLNHALVLHPTHAGLHLMAARLLMQSGHPEQATIEYAAALRGSIDPTPVLSEILKQLPPSLAASAIPPHTDFYRIDELVGRLEQLGGRDVAILVLVNRLQSGYETQSCELLYNLALATKQLDVAKHAATLCRAYEPTHDARTRLASLLLSHGEQASALAQLHDVESWDGRIDMKRGAWMMRCEAMTQLQQWDDAMKCLHRLQASGLLDERTNREVARRLDQMQQERAKAEGATGSGSGAGATANTPP